MWHIGFSHLYFKSRREEWSITVWKDVKYRPPRKAHYRGLPLYNDKNIVPYKLEPEVTDGQRQDNSAN